MTVKILWFDGVNFLKNLSKIEEGAPEIANKVKCKKGNGKPDPDGPDSVAIEKK